MTTNQTIPVHEFESSEEAYGACQCELNDGEVLHIPSEGVVGLAWTWPVAVTAAHGELHALKVPSSLADFQISSPGPKWSSEQIDAAIKLALAKGYTLHPTFAFVAGL
jgi:hypothetical protein